MIGFPKPEPRKRIKAQKKRAARKVVYSVRVQVVQRANGHCERCGRACLSSGEAHHRIPRSRGGKWTLENIQFLCRTCHQTAHRTGQL